MSAGKGLMYFFAQAAKNKRSKRIKTFFAANSYVNTFFITTLGTIFEEK